MKIILSKYIGPCFGVSSAIDRVFSEKKNIKIFGDIAHNEYIIKRISDMKNVKIVYNVDDIVDGDSVIIRTHGISAGDMSILKRKNIEIIDKTCPNVKLIHRISEECQNKKKRLIIVGNKNHPEVIGIKSRCKNITVINEINDVKDTQINKEDEIVVVAQTTYNLEKYKNMCDFLSSRYKNVKVYSTICNDSLNRRREIVDNLNLVDMILVIGSKKSSNSTKLLEFAKSLKQETLMISNILDIKSNMFMNIESIFVTSGSSVMRETVNEVIETIKIKAS